MKIRIQNIIIWSTYLSVISVILLRTTSNWASITVLFVSYTFGREKRAMNAIIIQWKEKFKLVKRWYPESLKKICLKLTQNNQSHAIEQCSDVGETVEKNAKFDWVDQVFDQEQASEFSDGCVDMRYGNCRYLLNAFLWQG